MKKALFLLAVLTTTTLVAPAKKTKPEPAAAPKPQGYVVDGQVAGADDGMLYIYTGPGAAAFSHLADSVMMTGGRFRLTGQVDEPEALWINNRKLGVNIVVFVENSDIAITTAKDKPFYEAVITGSVSDSIFRIKPPLYPVEDSTVAAVSKYIRQYPSSTMPVAALTTYCIPGYMRPVRMRELMALVDPQLHTSKQWVYLEERMSQFEKQLFPGDMYRDFTLVDLKGDSVSLGSVVSANKYVLLDFWGSWCPPCRGESPHLVAAYNKFKDKGFTIYGVTVRDPDKSWREAVEKDGLGQWFNVRDTEMKVNELYSITSYPSNFLIATDGTIVARNLRGEALEAKLGELLGE